MNVRVARPASAKQVAFAQKLAEQVHGENAAEFLAAHGEEGTFDSIKATSLLIDALLARAKEMPRAKAAQVEFPAPGYYAVPYQDVLRFYRVAAGKGRHEGRRFLNRYRSDFQDRVGREEQSVVVAAILADPIAARQTFARETVHCFRCGRKLTDQVSRTRGVGPECVKFI